MEWLKEKQVLWYHGIQLNDFKTYCEQGAVLSRRQLSQHNYTFTRFFSDSKDFEGGYWDRIFGNFVDFGAQFARFETGLPNLYGPITLVFSHSSWATMPGLQFSDRSVSIRTFDPATHVIDPNNLPGHFKKNNNGRWFPKKNSLEFSSSAATVPFRHLAYILVDPISYQTVDLVPIVEEILKDNRLIGEGNIITPNQLKVRELAAEGWEERLHLLVEWADSLKGRLLHRSEQLSSTVPQELADWLTSLREPAPQILASWLTYTYNGTLLHMPKGR